MFGLLRGENLELLSRELAVTATELSGWRDQFLAGGEASLKSRPADARDAETGRPQAKVGELTMTTELLEAKIERLEAHRPLARRRSRPTPRSRLRGDPGGHEPAGLALHGQALRPLAGHPLWGVARATLYRHRRPTKLIECKRPGPLGAMSDENLAVAIRQLLMDSPFHGEG